MYYEIATQSFSVVESNTLSVYPDLSCSFSGSTAISYTISNSIINGSIYNYLLWDLILADYQVNIIKHTLYNFATLSIYNQIDY